MVSVQVPDKRSELGSEFDLAVLKLFPETPTRMYLRKVLRQYEIGFITSAMLARRLIELVQDPAYLELFDICRPLVLLQDQLEFSATLPNYNLRRTMRRHIERSFLTDDFGFRVSGGRDQNCGIFISSVDHNSIAWNSGLRPGLQIMRINGLRVAQTTHRTFVDYIKISFHLDLDVKIIGMVPRPAKNTGVFWKFAAWNDTAQSVGHSSLLAAAASVVPVKKELLVLVERCDKDAFGVRVRRDPEGVRVVSVKEFSTASAIKILPTDVIVAVNEKRLENRDFEECLAFLKCDAPFSIRIIRDSTKRVISIPVKLSNANGGKLAI